MVKDEIINRMKSYFGKDEEKTNHALSVLHFAEALMNQVPQDCNGEVIFYAAILHDIGIPEAIRKHGSSAARYQEMEGPPIAREILSSAGVEKVIIDEVCQIIAHHHTPGIMHTINFKILYDADWMVNLPSVYKEEHDEDKLRILVEKTFLTAEGKELAKQTFLSSLA